MAAFDPKRTFSSDQFADEFSHRAGLVADVNHKDQRKCPVQALSSENFVSAYSIPETVRDRQGKSMFSYYKSAAAIQTRLRWSWPAVFALFAVGIVFLIIQRRKEFVPHSWEIPAQADLIIANGTFSAWKPSYKSPFLFGTDNGRTIKLGCGPDRRTNLCLDDVIHLQELAPQEAKIGYFVSNNSSAPQLANVLMTVEAGGKTVLSYSEARKRLLIWSVKEEQTKHSPIILFLSFVGPGILLGGAALVTATKLRFGKRYN
jgi:hypothetical protein